MSCHTLRLSGDSLAFGELFQYAHHFRATLQTELPLDVPSVAAPKAEALLPVSAGDIIEHKKGIIKFFNSTETWFGMTYPEDRQIVKDEIAKKIQYEYYPEKLWEK